MLSPELGGRHATARSSLLIVLAGGAAVGWPFAARAQQRAAPRRLGVPMGYVANDPEGEHRRRRPPSGARRTDLVILPDIERVAAQ